MKVIKPTSNEDDASKVRIFLAGSIEMDLASNWQDKVSESMKDLDVIFFNPRRDNWDSSWKQTKNDPQFRAQVLWELEHIDSCDIVAFYIDPNTKSPITLLELGMCAKMPHGDKNFIVCCPEGFWRKGNVDIVCEKYNLPLVETFDKFIEDLRSLILITKSLK